MNLPCSYCFGAGTRTGMGWGWQASEYTDVCDVCDGSGIEPCEACRVEGRLRVAVDVVDARHAADAVELAQVGDTSALAVCHHHRRAVLAARLRVSPTTPAPVARVVGGIRTPRQSTR